MTDKEMSREEARAYWDTHDIDTGPDDVEVQEEFAIKKPLTAMISIRLSPDDMAKLKQMAKARKSGVTTTARVLLEAALERPSDPATFGLDTKKLEESRTTHKVAETLTGDEPYYVFPRSIFGAWVEATQDALIKKLSEEAVLVTVEDEVTYEQLKTLAAKRS